MTSKIVILAIFTISAIVLSPVFGHHGGPGGKHRGSPLKKCCPDIPDVVKNGSMHACHGPHHGEREDGRHGGPRPGGPRPGGERGPHGPHGPPRNFSCMIQCAFQTSGFLSADNSSVDMAALNAHLTTLATGSWAAIVTEAQAACTAAAPAVEADAVCKSGACEVLRCINDHLLSKCPAKNDTAFCTRLAEHSKYLCSPSSKMFKQMFGGSGGPMPFAAGGGPMPFVAGGGPPQMQQQLPQQSGPSNGPKNPPKPKGGKKP